MRILYIGNKLAIHGNNSTSIDTLGVLLEAEGYDLIYASSVENKALRMLDMIAKTIRYGRAGSFVLIDTYSTSNFWYAFIISQLCRLMDLRYIPLLHGGNLAVRLSKNKLASRTIFKKAYCNVSPSMFLKAAFAEAGFSNVVYIPNSIEIENYGFKERLQFQSKLLWVRSFADIYNPTMALQVMSHLQIQFPQAKLCMVGPDKENMMPLMRKMVHDLGINAVFTGALPKEQWISLAAEYDIFINCTHYDNMPVSVVEAMALGLPVVSTKVGGIPFMLSHSKNGMLVDDNDAVGMAETITELIQNQPLATSIAKNARIAAEEFDWQKVKQKWLEILR